ncbi:ABC transporter ATP-binding protein [Acutalibacter muris]|uniref:ABC transporter ATP-binding protein n=1 Tax=Acutalibacter muris TaxID=1796620 RepID=A0A1Z2XQZ7_9FIRM|nr:ABC transporter ATP-binding protein [Acutalibacter muris]ANU55891.1 multidrug ABC transporter ATP-binding protein [Hungateiclostridiaceae bacterium KB18]ASB40865.1 ABC transporter ATP-binding protein [Acutalibacter muris]QQR30147.1 ABC transporter ATP-binding protein [Acutalibacter muris]
MDNIIEVKNVSKNFRETRALDNISLDFERGKIHGIIGRNGSGKTVLMKCICGFMTPTSGEVLVNGEKVRPSKAQENIGLIIETPGFIGGKSGLKNLLYLLAMGGKKDVATARNAMRAVGLDPENKKPVRKYSLGMRQRLGIAQAIMEDPELLILDEPMNGLDNQGVEDMRGLFAELRERGKTILLASHSNEDIRALCDTVCELDHGRVMARIGEEIEG